MRLQEKKDKNKLSFKTVILLLPQSLSYALDFDDKIAITDYKGQEEGALYISVAPCSSDGRALDEEYFVEDPLELIGKPYYYKVS